MQNAHRLTAPKGRRALFLSLQLSTGTGTNRDDAGRTSKKEAMKKVRRGKTCAKARARAPSSITQATHHLPPGSPKAASGCRHVLRCKRVTTVLDVTNLPLKTSTREGACGCP
jgi:hypothetical protein